jgi:Cdc6-like AAA superfamily ATPase
LISWRSCANMIAMPNHSQIDQLEAQELSIAAATAFQPRAPISTRELFAGRWEQLTTVADAVSQKGLHIIIFGERGVGKTSLANIVGPLLYVMEESVTGKTPAPRLVVKVNTHEGDSFQALWRRAFDEVFVEENRPLFGLNPGKVTERNALRESFGISNAPSIDEVRRALARLKGSIFIFDEFDRGGKSLRTACTDLVKALSDYAVESTVVIVGVSDTIDHLIRDHASIVRSIVQIQLPRMNERELRDILDKAAKALKIEFSTAASSLIVRMSQGLPHYTHLIGLHATREAANRRSRLIESEDVHRSFGKAVKQAVQSIQEKHLQAIHSAHREALYDKVLLACACASSVAKDALGYFRPADVVDPLAAILSRPSVTIATFQKHMNEFCEAGRGPVFERAGVARAYKYRFQDPLMPPYIFMTSVADGEIDVKKLRDLTVQDE